jgi:hypothetical protein
MRCRTWTGLLSAALLTSTVGEVGAQLKHNPYAAIIRRNAFGLRPVTPQTQAPLPPAPRIDVFLTGISTVGGRKKVLLEVADRRPGKKTEYLPPLVEKDVRGRVEVVSIDADKGAVVIKIDGDVRTLTFEKDAPKAGGITPPVPPPLPYSFARATRPGFFPPPPALGTAPPMASGKLSVLVGGAKAPGTAGPSLSSMPSASFGGVVDRGVPVVATLPPKMYGR